MIEDAREIPSNTRLEADIAIVGGGPAGLTIALELRNAGLSVLVLEAGEQKPGQGFVDAFHGQVAKNTGHPPLSLYRTRALGGTSTQWGGRCIPLRPQDLEVRPYVPWSGWPISYQELAAWYPKAATYCEIGTPEFQAGVALGSRYRPMVPSLPPDEVIDQDHLERFSSPTDFGRRYRRILAKARNIRVLVSATCNRIQRSPDGRGILGLCCAASPGHRFHVTARYYVLAAGALETTRLMLTNHIGNDLVGRFYMCHLEGKAAIAHFPLKTPILHHYERDMNGVYLRRHFSIPAEIQRREKITNVSLRFEPPIIADPAHHNAILSAMWLSRTFLKPEYGRKLDSFGYRGAESAGSRALLKGHLHNVVSGMPLLGRFGMDWIFRHVLARRKLPYVAVEGKIGKGGERSFTLDYTAEQMPTPDSRIKLSPERDAYGQPRLEVHWCASEGDVHGILQTHRLLAQRLQNHGAGRLEVDEEAILYGYNATGGHHIGTARMADSPSQGVVDRECRVFGIENLFVAGSAVFPTSGYANPTFTLVALAVRLAQRLKGL